MNAQSWALSEDLGPGWVATVLIVGLLALILLVWELARRERGSRLVLASGVLTTVAVVAAVLRPVTIQIRGSVMGARVVVLVDGSRRLLLPTADGATRRAAAARAVAALRAHLAAARLSVFEFGDDALVPFAEDAAAAGASATRMLDSDLSAALRRLSETSAERPQAIVVVSDGRLSHPAGALDGALLRQALPSADVPIHTVSVTEHTPADASVLRVDAAGTAVAHQPFELRVQVACVGGLRCGSVPVRVRELRLGADPVELAAGRAELEEETAELALTVVLERAGPRVLEIAIDAPPGDTIADNNRRLVAFDVARDRIRILHVAGRPGYDARALRVWLKGDESVDLVAFFILRTEFDVVQASDSELALIEFPVDELFTQHLPSFDAVILQDFDAVTNKLANHLPALARYVEAGGGLIMVGGVSGFSGGQYAGTELERVLPVTLPEARRYFDATDFVPAYTAAGRAAPILGALRELLGDELPVLPGANLVGPARPGAIVLWEHPVLRAGAAPMPILAIGEVGEGRTIALAVDGTHRLAFGQVAAEVGGRSYGAAWEGLLGWLMRDPRYEPARIRLDGACLSGEAAALEVVPAPGARGDLEVTVEGLGAAPGEPRTSRVPAAESGSAIVRLPPLPPGGYVARARVGDAPPLRFDFACERGGEAWADVRPDPDRLQRIARVTGGKAVTGDRIAKLPAVPNVRVAAERHVVPWLPAWSYTLGAALLLAAHWLLRRRGGLP